MSRVITGFKPTGELQFGNYAGAIHPLLAHQAGQRDTQRIVFLADLHALTVPHNPPRLRALVMRNAALLLACGLDPRVTPLYVQSSLPAHTELHYLLECVAGHGEAHRMIQFRQRRDDQAATRLSLLTYPVLMAADILLHDIEEVPVGADQKQHLELTRDLATRFNLHYGQTFTVPRATHPEHAYRITDLTDPSAKMGKSNVSSAGVLHLLDPPDVLRRKVMRAVTDSDDEVSYDPATRPGVANLLNILAVCTGQPPALLAGGFRRYGPLKAAVADALIALLVPIQQRYRQRMADRHDLQRLLNDGAARVRARAEATLHRARRAIGVAD